MEPHIPYLTDLKQETIGNQSQRPTHRIIQNYQQESPTRGMAGELDRRSPTQPEETNGHSPHQTNR